ncbi:MAG TPA: hypothetical protein VL949_01420 [Geobacteraceae bacterium]|nr:hypothetical protein [Geobacteraceae bacterium]
MRRTFGNHLPVSRDEKYPVVEERQEGGPVVEVHLGLSPVAGNFRGYPGCGGNEHVLRHQEFVVDAGGEGRDEGVLVAGNGFIVLAFEVGKGTAGHDCAEGDKQEGDGECHLRFEADILQTRNHRAPWWLAIMRFFPLCSGNDERFCGICHAETDVGPARMP